MLGLKCPWCFWQKSKVGGMMIKGDVKVLCVFWVLTVLLLVSRWKLFVWCLLMPNTYTIYYVFCFFGLIVGKQKLKRLKWHPHRKWKWHEFSRLLKTNIQEKDNCSVSHLQQLKQAHPIQWTPISIYDLYCSTTTTTTIL